MAIPEAVKRQGEEANKLIGELNEAQSGKKETGDPGAQPADPALDPAKNTPTDPDPGQQDPTKGTQPQPREDWKQKYFVLQGKYDTEVPALYRQVRTLQDDKVELNGKIDALAKEVEILKSNQSTPTSERDQEIIDPNEFDAYGEEYGKLARMNLDLGKKVDTLLEENQSLKTQIAGLAENQNESKKETFFGKLQQYLEKNGYDFTAQNADQGFLSWLAEDDPLAGGSRHQALRSAAAQLNVERAANIFMLYPKAIKLSNKQDPAPKGKDPAPKADPRPSVESQISPSPSPTDTENIDPQLVQAQGKTYTNADIQQFYSDKRRGLYRGREAEAKAMEIDILKAGSEGRVLD